MKTSSALHSVFADKAAEFVRNGFAGSRPGSVGATPPTREEIAKAAYYRAQARGFLPGGEREDWLAAERELNSARSRGR